MEQNIRNLKKKKYINNNILLECLHGVCEMY